MSYLPTNEPELREFAEHFADLTTATPGRFALVANDATQINTAVQNFVTKYLLATGEETRTAGAIAAKDAAKTTMIAILRAYAMLIKRNPAVEDQAKVDLGIGVYDFTRTPILAPTTRPIINIVKMDLLQHVLRFADVTTPESRARPAGAAGLQFFCHIGDAVAGAPADPLTCRFQQFTTKPTLTMAFDAADAGKKAFYFARWQTAMGKVGPFSQVASLTIAG